MKYDLTQAGLRSRLYIYIDNKWDSLEIYLYINYGNSLDDSYCTEMQNAALLMYAIYPFKRTNLHITVSGILTEINFF